MTPFQLKNTKKYGFDSYLDKESEIGAGKEMGSWNKENEEDEEDGDGPKLSLQTQATVFPSKWKKRGEENGEKEMRRRVLLS